MLKKGTISELLDYYFNEPKYKKIVERSMREFFDLPHFPKVGIPQGTEESVGFYNEWFLYDFIFKDEMSTLGHFVKINPSNLTDEELSLYKNLLNNQFGLFEVLEVQPLEGARLKLLVTGEAFDVKEFSATMDMQVGHGIFARISKIGKHYQIVGADSFVVPLADPTFKPYVKKLLAKKQLTPKDLHLMLTTGEVV